MSRALSLSVLLLTLSLGACATTGPGAGLEAPVASGGGQGDGLDNDRLHVGRALFTARCQRCHALPEPSVMSPEKWPAEVAGMASKSRLSPDQTTLITDYLVAASRSTRKSGPIQVVSR